MASGEIQLSLKVPLYIDEKDIFLVKRLKETARHFLGYEPYVINPTIVEPLLDEDLKIGPFSLKVIRTPGHTPGSVSYYIQEEQTVFTGDTLFMGAIGRTDLSYSDKSDLLTSLTALYRLPEETVVYSGHGDETTILAEKPADVL
jgi:glyoxylase-like metal-dependent hydrolase (beta-lactamase superfamily II)